MKTLITGAAGFIGFSLSKYLLELIKKNRIYGIDSLNSYYSLKFKKKRTNILNNYKNFEFRKFDEALLKTYNWYKKFAHLL
jgi:UDP-glucuronate 4-epimerase